MTQSNFPELFSRLPNLVLEELLSTTVDKFPFYNVSQDKEDGSYLIELAVAGFTKEDISVTCDNGVLSINGQKTIPEATANIISLYHSIAMRNFNRIFRIGAMHKVSKVQLKNGILTILLEREQERKTNSIPIE